MSEHFEQLRIEKELIKMREALMSDWRSDLNEEEGHPYVDVMPSTDQALKDAAKKKSKKKEEEESIKEKESVSESKTPPKMPPLPKKLLKKQQDPWSTHPDDAKAHSKEDYKEDYNRLDPVKQHKQIDKLRDSALSSDLEKSSELHNRADKVAKTLLTQNPDKLKDKCRNKKCSIDLSAHKRNKK